MMVAGGVKFSFICLVCNRRIGWRFGSQGKVAQRAKVMTHRLPTRALATVASRLTRLSRQRYNTKVLAEASQSEVARDQFVPEWQTRCAIVLCFRSSKEIRHFAGKPAFTFGRAVVVPDDPAAPSGFRVRDALDRDRQVFGCPAFTAALRRRGRPLFAIVFQFVVHKFYCSFRGLKPGQFRIGRADQIDEIGRLPVACCCSTISTRCLASPI